METKYQLLVAPIVLLFVVCAAAMVRAKPPAVEPPPVEKGSYVEFEIKAEAPTVLPAANEKPDRNEFNQYKRGLAAAIKSGFVINRALGDRAVQALPLVKQHGRDAAKWLEDQIVVKCPGDGNIMEVGMMSSDPKQAEVIVQAVANAFEHEIIDAERTEKLVRRDQLEKKFRVFQSAVLDKRRQLFQLENMISSASGPAAGLRKKIDRLEGLSAEADRAEIQAELQIARGKHKLAGLAATSPEYKAIQSEIDLAEVDRTFWHDKSASFSKQIDETAEKIESSRRFNGDTDQLRIDIAQLQKVVNEMGDVLTKWNIELDAAPRVRMWGRRSE